MAPTIQQLTEAVTNLILQRSMAKDQIENIEKQMAVVQAQLNLLQQQAAEAASDSNDDE